MSSPRIVSVDRRGKQVVIGLSSDIHLVIHLLMTGRLIFRSQQSEQPRPKFLRIVLELSDGAELCLGDKSGWVKIATLFGDQAATYKGFANLGVDIFSDDFTLEHFQSLLTTKRQIHPLLLDQTVLSGLGNIYVNEVLFYAGIHPTRSANEISQTETAALYYTIKYVTQEALKHRGTTFSDYRTPDGGKGQYQKFLKVFKRAGQPCVRCGSSLQRITVGGRGAVFCPNDQPVKRPISTPIATQPLLVTRQHSVPDKFPNYIFALIGPSSVGKTSLAKHIVTSVPHIQIVATVKTRSPRPGEIDGIDGIFVSHEEFAQMGQAGEFVIHGGWYGEHYGTPKGVIEETLLGGNDALIISSPEGASEIKDKFPNTYIVGLLPPSIEEVNRRIRNRPDYSDTERDARAATIKAELAATTEISDFTIITTTEEQTLLDMISVIYSARCSTDLL